MPQISGFPYSMLERITARAVAEETRIAATLRRDVALDEAAHHVGQLLGEPARVEARRHLPNVPRLAGNATVVVDALGITCHVTAESSFVVAVVAQLLGQAPPPEDPLQPIGASLEGAFNAATLWLAKRMCMQGVPRLAAAASTTLGLSYEVIVTTARARHGAYVTLAASSDPMPSAPPMSSASTRSLSRLRELPLSLSLFCGEAVTGAEELASAEVGDFWMPADGIWLNNALCGRGVVAAPRADRGARVDLDGEKIVVSGSTDLLHDATEMTSDDPPPDSSPGRAALDADVVVRIEVGRVTMTAAEWAGLRAGDVISTDAPIGATVRLYAAGQALAEGDLVDVEGKLGVRLNKAPRRGLRG